MVMQILGRIFKKRDTSVYAIQTGVYAGEMWAFVKQQNNQYHFLALPTMLNRSVECNVFESGKKAGIIDLVEQLPNNIHNICCKQFEKNNK